MIRSSERGHWMRESEDAIVKTALWMLGWSGVLLSSIAGCASDVSLGKNDDPILGNNGSGGSSGSDCEESGDRLWLQLSEIEWEISPGYEVDMCFRTTVAERHALHALRSTNNLNVLSAELSVGEPVGPDGTFLCPDALENRRVVMSSGPGTRKAILSEGQGLPVDAGEQLVLRVRGYNTSVQPVTARSTLDVEWWSEAIVTDEVQSFDPGILPEHGQPASLPPISQCDPWTDLIAQDWELEPGAEGAYCLRKTLSADATFREVEVLAPAQTAALVVAAGPPVGPDGVSMCPDDPLPSSGVVLGAASGSHLVQQPEGRSRTIAAGQQVLFFLDVQNPTFDPVRGTVTVRVR